jgi:hypothetical protein
MFRLLWLQKNSLDIFFIRENIKYWKDSSRFPTVSCLLLAHTCRPGCENLYGLLSNDYQGLFSLCLKRKKRGAGHSLLSGVEEEICKLASVLFKPGIEWTNVTLLGVQTSAKSGVTLLPNTRAVMSHWLVGRVRVCGVILQVLLAQEQRRKRRKFCLSATCTPQDDTRSAWATRPAVFTGNWFWNWVMGKWVDTKTRDCVINPLALEVDI